MKAYAPFHHLYAVSMAFCITSGVQEMAPPPSAAYERVLSKGQLDQVIRLAATSLNNALDAASNQPQPANRVFSPQNWLKSKACLSDINAAMRVYFNALPSLNLPGVRELAAAMKDTLTLDRGLFSERWAAD
jgi:hypothetical protein